MNNTKEHSPQFSRYHDLMRFRVREILLVSTPYDAFVLEEDGRLSEQIFSEFLDLNLQFAPRIKRVSSAEEAFTTLKKRMYDLIITMPHISDMDPLEFGRRIKQTYRGKPVVMLTYDTVSNDIIEEIRKSRVIDRVFYWSGDSKIFLAIIKYVEDRFNVDHDSKLGVQGILVIDDSPWYYSQFLPIIYTEVVKQTRYLISHAVNELHRNLRMRARPKILLAETYEEAEDIIRRYRNNLLGIISDVGFPKDGKRNKSAGFELACRIKKEITDLPVLLQSGEASNAEKARELNIAFLSKTSPNLLLELRSFILNNFGFGNFVFKYPDGTVIESASDMTDFERVIRSIPEESLLYHSSYNHFSRWFRARTEFEIADELRPLNRADFKNAAELRAVIISCLEKFHTRYQKGVILDFGHLRMDIESSFNRLGSGSLGGKGRGVAFFNTLLSDTDIQNKYKDIKIKTPRSFVICSGIFEEFMESNNLQEMAVNSKDEEAIAQRFLAAKLPTEIADNLRVLAEIANYPLAVRSSSILEDSQILPFAGIYKTYVLPNNHPDPEIRLKQLVDAIKLVYASVFSQSPKQYAQNADLRIEEEKMAILIQQLIGERHGDAFYPTFSGVAQSYNFYPISYMEPGQGVVSLALGFGRKVVEGGQVYRFSPAYPKMPPPYLSPTEILRGSQSEFYALDLNFSAEQLTTDDRCTYKEFGLKRAESDGVLPYIASTYSAQDDVINDTIMGKGPKVITFAPILKYNLIPLADILKDLFQLNKHAFGSDVEIEFAVNIPLDRSKKAEFYLLQIRPLVVGKESEEVKIGKYTEKDLIAGSRHTIGNGNYQNIYDIIYIDKNSFEITKTNKIASEIDILNKQLYNESRKCIIIGFGRLGTSDPSLGIPMTWSQMSQAKVVVEADLDILAVEPSLGSHFHHNLTSLKMGYLHIGTKYGNGEFVDWDWLDKVPVHNQTEHVKLIRSDKPFQVKIDGRSRTGVILRPNQGGEAN
ncbi:MAG: phosphoenolpyruvate synthase [Clostridia bacterium BRH_c25]|nr:MAG: phosphoenolpyruvate synthase [Clostridia bacterium BRH_c25]